MNSHAFTLADQALLALATGALYWPAQDLLCVSDLHLGKSERLARRGGTLLPPYETRETLTRLDGALAATGARHVVSEPGRLRLAKRVDGALPPGAGLRT